MLKKYHKVYKEESDQWLKDNQENIVMSSLDQYRLKYHLMPPIGWLNDPNGLCQKDGVHHLYFQYCPYNCEGDLKTWGHVTTKDYLNYQYQDIFLYPDTDWDCHGAYSGSAFIKDGLIHYFYTGNVKLFDRDDYDYIRNGRLSNTIAITSKDGFKFDEKKLVLDNHDYPENISNHIRDPKIFEYEGHYYMVLGARTVDDRGCVVLYKSDDLDNWQYYSQITTDEPFGYMWECPDMFKLDDQWLLLSCPQGVKQDGFDFANVHQTTVMYLDADFKNKQFKITKIEQLDRGFDFYAQQTYLDENKRRIMIGWMGIPDATYTNPTTAKMWQHALTLPRELKIVNGHLTQKVLAEFKQLRHKQTSFLAKTIDEQKLTTAVYELIVTNINNQKMQLLLKPGCILSFDQGVLTLDITESGSGRDKRSVKLDNLDKLHIFADTSSLEIFVNDGVTAFTTRVYALENEYLGFKGNEETKFVYYSLDGINF